MLLQHPVGGFEITAVAHHLRQPDVLDLRDIDRGIPGREQRRGADRPADLIGQRVHAIAEDRARIRGGVEIVMPRRRAEFVLDLAQDGVTIRLKGIVAGPDPLDDFHAGIVAVRMDADQPAAGPQRPHQRRHHLRGLELDAGAGAIRLRGDHQVVVGHHPSRPRHDRIEQERVVLAPQRQDDRTLIDRIAGVRTDPRAPVLGEKPFEFADLLGKAVRGVAGERDILPDQALRRGRRARRQPRRLGVIEIGDDETVAGCSNSRSAIFSSVSRTSS